MSEINKTYGFLAAALISMVVVYASQPGQIDLNSDQFTQVGEEFFPDFVDPNEADALSVVTFDDEKAQTKRFEVKFADGDWRIPSHYNYPADAQDQLAKTAASAIGIRRQAVAGQRESDYVRLGVVDPREQAEGSEGRGDFIGLYQGNTTLVELIVGNQVEGRNGFFYARRPDDRLTYIVELNLELSTQFTDWINDDLLEVTQTDLRKVLFDNYSIDEQRGTLVRGDQFLLSRDSSSDSWTLNDLAENEEMVVASVNDVMNTLAELKIVGVAPKPDGISADLKLNEGLNPDYMSSLDLQSRGFYLAQIQGGQHGLFSNEGEISATDENGVFYTLRFGEIFTGTEFDIQVGMSTPSDSADENAEAVAEESSDLKRSRYVFLTVDFDPSVLGDIPVEPSKPTEDEIKAFAEKADKADNEPSPEENYEAALTKYKADMAEYQDRAKTGQDKVKELRNRFADWYYVIDAESFDKLKKTRDEFVKLSEAEKPAEQAPEEKPTSPEPKPETAPKAEPMPETKPEEAKADTAEPKAEPKPESKPAESPAPQPTPEQSKPEQPKPQAEPETAQ